MIPESSASRFITHPQGRPERKLGSNSLEMSNRGDDQAQIVIGAGTRREALVSPTMLLERAATGHRERAFRGRALLRCDCLSTKTG
jgi:hypothetical protein